MSCKDVKALLLNHIFSFKQLTAELFMGIFYDVLTNHHQTYQCRFSSCIFMELAFGLGFFGGGGLCVMKAYLNCARCFVSFLLNFTVPLLLANVLGHINTVFTMCARGT